MIEVDDFLDIVARKARNGKWKGDSVIVGEALIESGVDDNEKGDLGDAICLLIGKPASDAAIVEYALETRDNR